MKNITVIFFFLFHAAGAAGPADTVPIVIKKLDSVTAKGKPEGRPVTMEIDRQGGRIISEDGKLELIFPEGALNKKKKISIQGVSNMAANGRGPAYEFSPAGTQFEKAVTLIYHYSPDEMNGSLVAFKGLACQDEQGKWSALKQVNTDTVARTIRSFITHFSTYAPFDRIVLQPAAARVKVDKSIPMFIQWVTTADEEPRNENEDYLPPLPPSIPQPEWRVNQIVMGSADVGRIITNNQTFNAVDYRAPASVPEQNPVAVSARMKGMEFRFNNIVYKDPELVSHVLVYDRAYRITIQMWVDNSEDGMCTMRLEDEGSFTVVMEGVRTQVKEISNSNIRLRFNPCKCGFIWKNNPVPGPINITGTSRIDVTAARLPDLPFSKLSIYLKHARSPMPDLRTTCPASGMPPGMGMASPWLPPLIAFEANNDEERIITLADLSNHSISNTNRYGMKVLIRKIED